MSVTEHILFMLICIGITILGIFMLEQAKRRSVDPTREEVLETLADARDSLRILCSRYGYHDDNVTPKDWDEWEEARRVRDECARVYLMLNTKSG